MNSTSPRRRGLLFGGVAAVAAAAGIGGAWWRHSSGSGGGDRLDASVWAARFDRPEGGELDFASLRGKPLLVNFWATWCPPCVEELPMVDRFFRDQAANGWQVVGLAIDQPTAVRKFLSKTPVSFPIGLAGMQGTDLVRELGNTSGGLPFTLAIAADGRVLARKMGKLETSDLEAWSRA